jgi:Lon protease-like protein
MLAWSLEHHRMFCIALMKPGLNDARTSDEFHHIGGLGLIRACVGHEDGTSHLILQGMVRVEMTRFRPGAPFPHGVPFLRRLRTTVRGGR